MIVNLQRPGEHPYCGPNTLDILSGYSYTPSLFSTEGISVKLCGWKDMDVPDSLYFMLDIVKEMIYVTKHEKKRVLVHCHAGKGRTGVVIACYLMFKYHIKADEAVKKVREKRPKCIESKSQMEYCKRFFQFISGLREIFCKEKKDVYTFIKHQNDLILKTYANQNNYDKERSFIPLMILITLNLLLKLKKKNLCENIDIYKSMNGSCDLSDEIYANIQNITIEINKGNWKVLKKCKDPILIGELMFIWMDDCINYCVNPANVDEAIFAEIEIDVIKKEKIYNLLLNYENIDNNLISKIYIFFQNKFKKYEWEILKFFSVFLKEILPKTNNIKNNNNNENNNFTSKTPKNSINKINIANDILIIHENKKEEDEISHSDPIHSARIIEEEKQYQLMLEKIGIFILGFDIDLLYENQSISNINNNNSISMIEKTNSYLNSVKNTILLLKFLRDTLNENYRFYETELYYIKSPTQKNGNLKTGNLKTFKDFAENYKNSINNSNINSESNKSNISCNSNSLNHSQEIINHNHINNNINNESNNVHSHSLAHSNSSFFFSLNKKNVQNNLSTIKELETNKEYEKKLFEVYKTLKLHFEKNLSWSKIGFKKYENIYNNLDMSELSMNQFKNKNFKNLQSLKNDFKINIKICEKEDENEKNENEKENNNENLNVNNDSLCKLRKNLHSKSNQIPKVNLKGKKYFDNMKKEDFHVSFYDKKKKNSVSNNNFFNSIIFRNNKKRSTLILKNLFNTNVLSEDKNSNSLMPNVKMKKLITIKSNKTEIK